MIELSNDIIRYMIIGFWSWVLVGSLLTIGYAKYVLGKTELFAVIFACLWIFTIITSLEVSQYFHIMWMMSWMHLVGERAVKNFTSLILELKWVNKK